MLQTMKSDRVVESLARRVTALEERLARLEDSKKKEPTEKDLLKEKLDEKDIKYSNRDSIVKLKELLGE